MLLDLLGTPRLRLSDTLDQIGVGRTHTSRLFGGLHRQRLPLDAIANLGRHAKVVAEASWMAEARVLEASVDDDTTEKLVIGLHDGARIEAVLVPMHQGRRTLCVSTQVGCAMGCTFCATGTLGLTRNLSAGEIVAQVQTATAHAAAKGQQVTRLVFMGMGEPLHNDKALFDALSVLLDGHGAAFSSSHVVVSTVGLVDKLRRFGEAFDGRVGLALSLHAGTDATRARIVPTARTTSLATLRAALEAFPYPSGRKLMLEVVVLPGVNDGPADLDGISAFAAGLPAIVNLIPFNPFPGSPFRSPQPEEVMAMHAGLKTRGTLAKIRWPKGRSSHGACGQLALRAADVGPG